MCAHPPRSRSRASGACQLSLARSSCSRGRREIPVGQRSTLAVTLTEEGRDLVPAAQQLLDSADALQERTGRRRTKPVGRVRLSVPVPLGLYFSSKLNSLLKKHDELSIDLILHDRLRDLRPIPHREMTAQCRPCRIAKYPGQIDQRARSQKQQPAPRGAISRPVRARDRIPGRTHSGGFATNEFSRPTRPLCLPLVHMKSTSRYELGPRSTPHHLSP